MPNANNFNKSFLFFVTFIFSISIFYLYQKHTVGNDSTISEWLINYQGGFTRRGLIGEISFIIADLFDLKLRFVIFLFQATIYLIYTILIYNFFKNIPNNVLAIITLFSPILFMYPISEIEVLARKEIFIFISFIIFLNLSNIKFNKNYSLIYVFLINPIICLIWEPFIFFIPFSIYVILNQHKDNDFKILFLNLVDPVLA